MMPSGRSSADKPLTGQKIAILLANGFEERDLTEAQRALMDLGATTKIVSSEQGLANSWANTNWGHYFAVDAALASALAADFSMLVVPGGQRSVDKLKLTAHTRRFVTGFMLAQKPVALFAEAAQLLVFAEQAKGQTVNVPENLAALLQESGATVSNDVPCISGAIISACPKTQEEAKAFAAAIGQHFVHAQPQLAQAA